MIRWGILGCGDIAQKRVAEAIQTEANSQLIAACRRNEVQLKLFRERFDIPIAFQTADELFASDEIDAVYVATPVYLHCQNVLDAAAAGKHVIVEKPMAMDTDECDRMIAACTSAGVKLSVAYYRNFYPVVERIKQLLEAGEIGRTLSVTATTGNSGRYADDHWRVIPAEGGGGPLMDIGSHRLDLLLDLFGEVSEVSCFCEPGHANSNVEGIASVLLRFQNAVHGTIQCYFGTSNVPDHLSVVGDAGRLVVEPLNDGQLRLITPKGERFEAHRPHDNLHAPLIADFTRAIIDDGSPRVTGEQGRSVTTLIDRAYNSAKLAVARRA